MREGQGKRKTLSVLIPNVNSTEKLPEGILTERRFFPWNSDREFKDSKKILTERCVRGILKGRRGFLGESWGEEWGFRWDPEGRTGLLMGPRGQKGVFPGESWPTGRELFLLEFRARTTNRLVGRSQITTKYDLQIMRSASLLSFCCLCIQHRPHTYSHTHSSHTASMDLGGWQTVPPRGYSLGFFHLDTSLFCRDPLSLLTSDLLYRQGTSLSISCLIYMSCAQTHPRRRILDGRCTPRCSQRCGGWWLLGLCGLVFQAGGRCELKWNLAH